jgi:hypothetical protein
MVTKPHPLDHDWLSVSFGRVNQMAFADYWA